MLTLNTILQNRYQIIRQLGQGGMGTVYEAKALRLNTTVALKETNFTDEQLRKQFEREAQLLANLRHPALPRVIDHFDEGDGLFLVMDFIKGEDLWEMLQRNGGAFPVNKVLEWVNQLLDALDYLHKQEPPIIHRDIKPQNLKLSNTGQIILLDFGLAKGFAGQISRVTTSGSIFGYTPNYAPLEQIQGTGTDPRSDLYSLAATLYHLMTGQVPPDVLTRLTATTEGQSDPLRSAKDLNPQVPIDVANLLNKAMSIPRNQRFNSAAEMRKALHDIRRSEKEICGEEAEALPPPVISPASAEESQGREAITLQPTIADIHLAQHSKVSDKTVASPTVASPTDPSTNPTIKAAPPIVNSQSSILFEQAKPKSGRLSWLIVGLGSLLVVGIIVAFIFTNNSITSSSIPSGSNPGSSNTNVSLDQQRLESALRAGSPDFEQYRKSIVLDGLEADEATRAIGDIVMSLRATVRNLTGRTINGLEIHAAVVDFQNNPVKERTVVVIPTRQAELAPNKTMGVQVTIEGMSKNDDRANIKMDVTAIKFK